LPIYNFDGLDPDDESAVEDVRRYFEARGTPLSDDDIKKLLRELKDTALQLKEPGTEGEEDDDDDGPAKS
jgi:hypothetical protein